MRNLKSDVRLNILTLEYGHTTYIYLRNTSVGIFFEVLYKMPGNSAKLDQRNTKFCRDFLLGQASVIVAVAAAMISPFVER